ncbi:hypothetical protein DFP72DRAFT_353008 [Ephemerocybe angulata]|uniref:Uncharacterized protein n=1 Tax=Ephemerocybe angulata TaxID=980116 RepID=A0A8H6M6J6_9AGAR|nr:hypothetical protein DFP72DRAFT_353008 [Tulosesus angulatus]
MLSKRCPVRLPQKLQCSSSGCPGALSPGWLPARQCHSFPNPNRIVSTGVVPPKTRHIQTSATNAAFPYPPPPGVKHILSTLNPTKLIATDYVDLSKRKALGHTLQLNQTGAGVVVRYKARHPFPPSTRGFFYFHRPTTTTEIVDQDTGEVRREARHGHVLSGQLRFRMVDTPDPARFEEGADLPGLDGLPWHIPLAIMHQYPIYEKLLPHILSPQELLDIDAFLQRARLHPKHLNAVSSRTGFILESILEPFVLDFSKDIEKVILLDPDCVAKITFKNMFTVQPRDAGADYVPQSGFSRYSGQGLVRFDLVTSIRVKKDPITKLSARLLKWIVPPNPDDTVFQEEGELLKKFDPSTGKERVWMAKKGDFIPAASFKVLEDTIKVVETIDPADWVRQSVKN